MAEVTRRKWLQVHLSTALVLMFVAGTLIWANVLDPREEYLGKGVYHRTYGWPWDAVVVRSIQGIFMKRAPSSDFEISKVGIAINLAGGIAILFVAWLVCERWVRWRTTRKIGQTVPDAPRREWLQLHLSTAVVLMFVAGGILWLNLMPRELSRNKFRPDEYIDFLEAGNYPEEALRRYKLSAESSGGKNELIRDPINGYGWPEIVYVRSAYKWIHNDVVKMSQPARVFFGYGVAGVNFSVALAILFAVWFVCEWWIHRRAVRKRNP
ncbi:MAG TPA: hypothetical protein VKX17_04245 [Planctomycetota bacterium]|nr:hypothetical protein [Planctomycetota bacterium]